MILPITAYGHQTLRKISEKIDKNYPDLKELIDNMFDTMRNTSGVGLAAPQVNLSICLFIIDTAAFKDEYPKAKNFKKIFINAKIIEETGEEWLYKEGCLSIPDINEEVSRKSSIIVQYYDENLEFHEEKYDGIIARIIQHECDHLNGILFVDRINNLRKMLLKKKLTNITTGKVNVSYKMIFPFQKRKKK